MLTVKEQIADIVKDHIKTAPVEMEAYIAIQSGTWDAFDMVSGEQADEGVTVLCHDVAKTILREFVVLEKENDDE